MLAGFDEVLDVVLADQFESTNLSDLRHTGDVVAVVPHERFDLGPAVWRDAVLVPEVVASEEGLLDRIVHLHFVTEQLVQVLVC